MPDASGLMRKCKNSNLLLVNVNLNKKLGKQCFTFTEDNDLEYSVFFFQAEDGIRDHCVTGVQTCALPIYIILHNTATCF